MKNVLPMFLFCLFGIVAMSYQTEKKVLVDLSVNTSVKSKKPDPVKVEKRVEIKSKNYSVAENYNKKDTISKDTLPSVSSTFLLEGDEVIFKKYTAIPANQELQLVDTMRVSRYAYTIITDCEGFKSIPHYCGGFAIGFGRAITGKLIEHYRNNPISFETAYKFLIEDVENKSREIRMLFSGRMFTQGQFDALVSMCYNMGFGRFKSKDLVRSLITGDMNFTVVDFISTVPEDQQRKYKGLKRRRKIEYYMFNNLYLYINKHKIL